MSITGSDRRVASDVHAFVRRRALILSNAVSSSVASIGLSASVVVVARSDGVLTFDTARVSDHVTLLSRLDDTVSTVALSSNAVSALAVLSSIDDRSVEQVALKVVADARTSSRVNTFSFTTAARAERTDSAGSIRS